MQTVLGWTARGRWLEYGQASAGKRAAFPEDRKQRRQRDAGRKKGNGKGEDGKEAKGTPGGREADSGEREGGFREGKRESPVREERGTFRKGRADPVKEEGGFQEGKRGIR